MRLAGITALAILFLFFSVSVGHSRQSDELKKKRSQLEKLRTEINNYETRIKEREKKEHATLDLLDTYDRQAALLRKFIVKLHDEEEELQKDIAETRKTISELNGEVSSLKQNYARYVSAAYRAGRTSDLELLITSQSFNQMLIREEYLRRFSVQRKSDLVKLDSQKNLLEIGRASCRERV